MVTTSDLEGIWDDWEDDDLLSSGISEAVGGLQEARSGGKSIPIPTTDDELWQLVYELFNIRIPRVACCHDKGHVAPFTAFADAFFARAPVTVWLASRGFGGKSLTLSLLSLTEAAVLGAFVNLLGGSGEQAQRVLAYMNGEEMPNAFWGAPNAPIHLLRGGFERGMLMRETKLNNGGVIRALMASQKSVRGPHPQRLRLDEIDEMDLDLLDAALGQPMERMGIQDQTVMSSTHHNADGTMTAILKRAKEMGWPVQTWCYHENLEPHGWLSHAQVERKKATVTQVMWENEYELQEPNPESRAIPPELVELMFSKKLGSFRGSNHEYIEIEPPDHGGYPEHACWKCKHPYMPDDFVSKKCANCKVQRRLARPARYSTGTDWAKRKDYTVIVTLRTDVRPVRGVAFERMGRIQWPVMTARLEDRLRRFVGPSIHDETGIGDVLGDYIEGVASEGFWMSGQARASLLTDYLLACEKGMIVYPRIEFMYDEHRLASRDDIYKTGESYHLPDTISAGSLAWRAAGIRLMGEILIPGVNILRDVDQEEV